MAYLQVATFQSLANFQRAAFQNWAYFQGATFQREADFSGATFEEEAIFHDMEGRLFLVLNGTIFEKHPPEIFGTKLHPASSIQGTTWPKMPKNREGIRAHSRAYVELRMQFRALGIIDEANEFSRKEIEHYTALYTGINRYFGMIYRVLSNHGTSIGRPLAFLFGHWALVVVCWLSVRFFTTAGPGFVPRHGGEPYVQWRECGGEEPFCALGFWEILAFNLGRILPLTSFRGYQREAYVTAIEEAPGALLALSFSLSLLAPLYLFLLALGLRARFRITT